MSTCPSLTEIRQEFDQHGYVILPEFLPPERLTVINEQLDAYYSSQQLLRPTDTRDDTFRSFECDVVGWDPCAQENRPFLELRDDPRLWEVTTACLGSGYNAGDSLVMFAKAGGKGQSWHQDCRFHPTQFNLNRLFYTRDVTLDNGAIVIVPGSHRGGRIPPGGNQESIEGEIVLTPSAGTLVLLSGLVFHRVTPNYSDQPRISVNFRAYPPGVASDVCKVGVYRNGVYDFEQNKVLEHVNSR